MIYTSFPVGRCGKIANETTIHKRKKDADVSQYIGHHTSFSEDCLIGDCPTPHEHKKPISQRPSARKKSIYVLYMYFKNKIV